MAFRFRPKIIRNPILFTIFLSLIIASCFAIYWPGLDGIFLLDDYPNLKPLNDYGGVVNKTTLLHFVFGGNSSITGRPVSMLAFLVDDQYWPGSAFSYKYTNLLIHILCGLLILLFTYNITKFLSGSEKLSQVIAIATAAYWLFHPLNVSTTLYVIQRMTQLSLLFSLSGLILYFKGRTLLTVHPAKSITLMSIGVILFGILAALSKETGALLILFTCVLEVTIFYNLPKSKAFRIWFSAIILFPLVIAITYLVQVDFYTNSYGKFDFTQYERILTESRILLQYLYQIIFPNNYGHGLIHDDIVISSSVFDPYSTIFAAILNIALIVAAIASRKRAAIFSMAILWYYCGHLLESTFIPLELYFEHRNYMPMIGPIMAIMYYSIKYGINSPNQIKKFVLLAIPCTLVLISIVTTSQSVTIWRDPATMFKVWTLEHPNSLRANRIYGQFLAIDGKPELAIETLNSAYQNIPEDISLLLETINIACKNNFPLVYSISDFETKSNEAKFTDGILPIAKILVDNIVKEKCNALDFIDIHRILFALENIEGMKSQPMTMSQLLFLHSDIYVLERNLNPAIELLDKAYKFEKTTAIPLRQARLLASASLYDEALNYIQIAKSANSKRKMFKPSILDQINILENQIKIMKTNSTKQ